jgi:xanthine dehydrogenase YagT iron-sulfur-binding subunit
MPMDDDPATLPPTDPPNPSDSATRRDFLITSAALGTGAALAGCAGHHAANHAANGDASRASATASPAAPTPKSGDKIRLTINGQPQEIDADPRITVLDALRERLNLTGTKKGCDHGQCGACTVLIDGRRVLSCLTLAAAASGAQITTIEGLAKGDELHPVQAAFIKHDAFQCGYCTPGQICSAVGLIKEGRARTDADIREQMSGNLCRCGAYVNIVAAVKEAMAATPSARA